MALRTGSGEVVSRGSCFVEVGAYLGRSLCSLGEVVEQSGKTFTIVGIDLPWQWAGGAVSEGLSRCGGGAWRRQLCLDLDRNIMACGYGDAISIIIADSPAVSGLFGDASVDWVHLDARHDDASVKADIGAWLPKVKPGGWSSGDDYDEIKWPEVVKAVGELLPGAAVWSTQQWRYVVA